MISCRGHPTTAIRAYGQPLGVINLARAEQGIQGVVAGDDEASEIDEELSSNVEEDQEEVETGQGEENVDLGHTGLLLEIVEHFIFGQLGKTTSQHHIQQQNGYFIIIFEQRGMRRQKMDSQ
jgi:hypothetical protein